MLNVIKCLYCIFLLHYWAHFFM